MKQTIRNAYVSVEIADSGLESLRQSLHSLIAESGVECEMASSASHVSIAYGEGEIEVEALDRLASEIASLPFSVRVGGFEILKGQSTPFDFLVVTLEGEAFDCAVSKASGCMKTRAFAGGFRSHLSLLKFPKGSFSTEWAEQVTLEMNGCQSMARALGRQSVALLGRAVAVFGDDRQPCLTKTFIAA